MGKKGSERRRRLLINPKIQLAYWKLILTAMFLTALLIFACLYQFLDRLVLKNPSLTLEQTRAFLELFNHASIFLLFAFPSLTITLLIWGLLISNRIAGPLYRLEKDLNRILSGEDFRSRIPIRKNDELSGLSNQINHLLEKIESYQKGSP